MIEEFKINSKTVFFSSKNNGGGIWFGQDYIHYLKHRYPDRVFDDCLEWCAGPGFIGYSILDSGICNNLTLLEKHAEACEDAIKTQLFPDNDWKDKVNIVHCDTVKNLEGKFDLIVSDPPFYDETMTRAYRSNPDVERIAIDVGWKSHKDFFSNIKKNLKEDGIILLFACAEPEGLTLPKAEKILEGSGLKITDYFKDLIFKYTNHLRMETKASGKEYESVYAWKIPEVLSKIPEGIEDAIQEQYDYHFLPSLHIIELRHE